MSQLQGIRVLELSDGLVDLGGRMLAELGATVISLSRSAPQTDARELAWGHGKHRFTWPEDISALSRILEEADLLLEDRRRGPIIPDAMLTGLDQLIHVVARPYSAAGPRSGHVATDLTLMAQSGLMHITGDPDRPPLRFPGEQAYALTGIQVATAGLMALHARRRTGCGQCVEVSALQATTLANYREAIMYEWTGRIGNRTGNRLVRGKSGVRQVWPCADGHVTWSMIDNPNMMRAVINVLEQHDAAGELAEVDWGAILVADMPQDVIGRWEAILEAFFAHHTKGQLGQWSLELGWGLSVIHDLDEVRDSAHLRERGLFVPIRSGDDEIPLPGPLFHHGAGHDVPVRTLMPKQALDDFRGWETYA
ncbi:CoA transferase [Roseinatronobacter alkalisoli]|uniref:CoA transferase n=1 Tax=Roseinatronobacter alkalisoli TaxID=3028235 RepID=A0ABT5TDD7_9RHOB|nr:CoA transferase [Roseinatronobacter sp. HJB301]MDD7972710.1 CoA transferase [Roseinatronobacter sp. HJB301]